MSRSIAAALLIAALALLGTPALARTEIVFWHAMDGQAGEATNELVERFNRSQDEFEVKAVFKGDYATVMKDVEAAYRQHHAPHLVQVYEVGTQSMLHSHAIIPMERILRQQAVAVDRSDFIEAVVAYYAHGGQLYSAPFNASTPILYYNRDAFHRAGLPDRAPATWPEVESASRALIAAGAASCGFTTPWLSWTLLENTFAWHDQPFATNRNGYAGLNTRLLINSAFGRMHVGALARWFKDGIFGYTGPTGQAERFLKGECAMLLDSSASIGGFKQAATFEWGTGHLPHWGPPYRKANTILGGATLWAMRGQAPAAYKGIAQFVGFITQAQQQAWWASTTGYMPITRAALSELQGTGFYERNPAYWTPLSQVLDGHPTQNSRGLRLGNYVQVRQVIEFELQNIFDGSKSVRDGLDAAVARGNAILREFGVTHDEAPQGEI